MNSMAEYINGPEMTASFREVIDKLKTGQLLSEEQHTSITSTLESNEKWINDNYQDIFDFFERIDATTTQEPTTPRSTPASTPISTPISTSTQRATTPSPGSGNSVFVSITLIFLCVLIHLMK
jgi:hypothetical protein